jgi:quercetin dioxygenase-like cupin family protein
VEEKVIRVVSGDDGKTRFEEGSIDFSTKTAPDGSYSVTTLGDCTAGMASFDVGFSSGLHNTTPDKWMFVMQGSMEIIVSDGESRVVSAGDIITFCDGTGPGHDAKVLGDLPVLVVSAAFFTSPT